MDVNKYHRQLSPPCQGETDVEEGHPDMSSSACPPRILRGRYGLVLIISLVVMGFGGFCVARMISHHDDGSDPGTAPEAGGGNISGPSMPAVVLNIKDRYVVVENGIVGVTFLNPEGSISAIKYGGVENLLEELNDEHDRGYYDAVWSEAGHHGTKGTIDRLEARKFEVIFQSDERVEISFSKTWNSSFDGKEPPLQVDKRYVLLRGSSGYYTYAIYEHLGEWPAFIIDNTRTAIKLRKDKFHYMSVADNRQRFMPLPDDRLPGRGQRLAYPEAVRLTDPVEPEFTGQVDDKYQYSCNTKDVKVHGWISMEPAIGVWQITPSNEFRSGGPTKQLLTSHVGPTSLNVFTSAHYGGEDLIMKFATNESWKKVYGPVFVYLNSLPDGGDPFSLWDNAKEQYTAETKSWPYTFPNSTDYVQPENRGSVSGRLLVHDKYVSNTPLAVNETYVGLAPPGDVGSWQREAKGYQFWTTTDKDGYFVINAVIAGEYNLYAFAPSYLGDYKYNDIVTVSPVSENKLGELVFESLRNGPTLWEIGVADRTAQEFYIPDPNPDYINPLYLNHTDRFRQYGLWERYSEIYPVADLVFTVGQSDYQTDWFYAQVTRKKDNETYEGTTWKIKFQLDTVDRAAVYKLHLALATAQGTDLQVRVNNPAAEPPLFSTGIIGKDNAIARHGIHGLYRLFSVDVPGSILAIGENTIFLTVAADRSPFQGVMYDYIRFEAPPVSVYPQGV